MTVTLTSLVHHSADEIAVHFEMTDGTYKAVVYSDAVHRKDADGVWDLSEKVLELFLPDFSDGVKFTQVCGIDFVPVSWNPIESDESISAYCLTFEGTEFLLK